VPLTIYISLLLSLTFPLSPSFPLSLGARSVSRNSQQGVPRPELGSSCPHVRHRPFCRRQEHCEDEEQREGAVPARQATDQRQAGRPHKAAERPGRNGIHPPYLLLCYFSRASSPPTSTPLTPGHIRVTPQAPGELPAAHTPETARYSTQLS
jgi:hypothetical protein